MRVAIRQNRMAAASFLLLAAGWAAVGLFVASGMHGLYPAAWWVRAAVFCSDLFGPVAGVLAVGGLLFDARKALAWIALLLSVLTTVAVMAIGV